MKQLNLGKEPINKLLITFAVPCVISMLINSVYNIVDQIFIGKGVGTVGNAATNVIFPLVLIFGAIASLLGNGTSANLSLRLGEGKNAEAKKALGSSITVIFVVSLLVGILSYIFLPQLVTLFGSTESVYPYALSYGKIIALGAPFVIIYSALSSIIRADGSPKYSMIMLVIGAIINIILDPIFIFTLDMGVRGGAIATVIGQVVSCVMAVLYLFHMKSIKLKRKDLIPNSSIFRVMGLGLSSFITQMTVLVLFVFMNNMLTGLGASTKFGADIPLSVYGIISKVNSLYISTILGIAIGAQPIIGFNYGAGNRKRVQEILRKVLFVNVCVGIFFNVLFVLFPQELVSFFITKSDANYELFMDFSVLTCRSFMMIMGLNALEITTSIVVQSLGNVFKATMVSFARQIILFIPIACLFAFVFHFGIYGVLYAGPIADALCFFFCIYIFVSEYRKLSIVSETEDLNQQKQENSYSGPHFVVTISREYGSGGRYVGQLLANELGVPFYDKELISLSAKESGLSSSYVAEIDEKNTQAKFESNNDDRLFMAETKVIQKLAKKESCVIVGRCADYILKDEKDVVKVFLYSDDSSKVNRVIKYYGVLPENAFKKVKKMNRERAKHYKFYTNRNWDHRSNYDLMIHVDILGVEETAQQLSQYIKNRFQ